MDFKLLQDFLAQAAATEKYANVVNNLQQLLAQQNPQSSKPEGESALNPELKKKKEFEDIFLCSTLKDLDHKEPSRFGKRRVKTSMMQVICKQAKDRETLFKILCRKSRP